MPPRQGANVFGEELGDAAGWFFSYNRDVSTQLVCPLQEGKSRCKSTSGLEVPKGSSHTTSPSAALPGGSCVPRARLGFQEHLVLPWEACGVQL